MINIIEGNILNAKEDIICQQVNCQGVMGAGLAKQIKNKYPKVYENYRHICQDYKNNKKSLLGQVIFGIQTNDNKIIANLCGQDKYGRDKQYTNYSALRKSLNEIYNSVTNVNSTLKGKSIAIPYGIGCGLAGGNWDVVYKMIEDIFKDYDVTIYKLS
ncbi:macro domain-containing protein [Clostridium sp.]|uniref:macro domain-containing protein n=1 Tax=Clostridium sp. TaxID=1506 RepID=UPI0026034D15|nr:macro domain-containing protein [Clostridium sp.]